MWTQVREPLPCQSLDSNESQCQVTDTAPNSRNDDAVSEPRPEPTSSSKDQDPLLCSLQEPESNAGPLRIMTAIDVQGTVPIIDSNNIYRLKDVVNVGFWQGNTYVKIHTPEVVAYHDNNEQLYLAPNLKMCTLTKDIHYLCPSKPFVRDNTEGICGLESIRPDTSCPAEATPRSQVEVTQAEIIGNRWLVNTPARTATLTYDQHDTATRIILPNQTLWITVPKGSILHIDELALYHLTDDEYQAEIEISPFFKQHSFVLDPELEERIKEEGTQLIDLTPVDTALEAIARLPPAGAPIIRSCVYVEINNCILIYMEGKKRDSYFDILIGESRTER
ncbi:hypothetical protein G5714_004014 [Onychostoma macrolepis]|uniref:Uncharacterized protein n=1 Tax=Onychostoma macrolepis TaxID=369639 RepID=A0A7J6DBX9_9TELE|nr:hypothetical protein G5714_004014 [Onychostoma macrolepis]